MTCLLYVYNKYRKKKCECFLKKEQSRRGFLVIEKEGEDEMVTGSKLLAMI